MIALSMKYILEAAANGDMKKVTLYVAIIAGFFLMSDIPAYFFRNMSSKFSRNIESYLYQTYISKYIVGENNALESIGTGRINNIISKGISSRNRLLTNMPVDGIRFVVSVITGFVVIAANI